MAFTFSYANSVRSLTAASGENAGLLLTGGQQDNVQLSGTTLRVSSPTVKIAGVTAGTVGQLLRILGVRTAATLTTGVNTGTAGSSTTTTVMYKPTAAANWTANNLVGKFLEVTGGGGYSTDGSPVLRPILANTTTTLTVATVTGMDSTTTFNIVTLDSQIDRISASDLNAIRIAEVVGPVEIYGLDFSSAHALDSLIAITDCSNIKISGCKFNINCANPSVYIRRTTKVTLEYCTLGSSADVSISDGCQNVAVTGVYNSGGGVVDISDCLKADVLKMTASSATTRALSMSRVFAGTAEVTATSCGATPVYLEDVTNFRATGTAYLTGSGNTGYGVEVATGHGYYRLVGSDMTGGTGDVLFMGNAVTWTNLSGTDYGIATEHAGSAFANSGRAKAIHYGNELHMGDMQYSSRVLWYGIRNPAQNTAITATGTTTSDAYQLPAGEFYRIDTVASGTGVKLHNSAALPGVEVVIYNNGANTLKVYPTSGTIDGGASKNVSAATKVRFTCTDYASDKWITG